MIELTSEDHRALKQKLERLSSDSLSHTTKGRTIKATDRDARLESILIEIDDSMLGETLFLSGGGISLGLAVAGRRLIGLISATGISADKDIIGQAISPEDQHLMTSIKELIFALVTNEAPLHLTVGARAKLADGATIGASVAQLRCDWGLVTEEPVELTGDTPLAQLASGIGDAAIATVALRGGSLIEETGSEHYLQALSTILEDQLMSFDETRKNRAISHRDPSLTCFLGAGPDGSAIVLAMHGQDISLFAIPNDKAALPHVIWQKIQSA